jgi:DNA modification methylase
MIALANADSRRIPLADQSVQCVITSPPYWGLRDYGHSDQIGLESTPALYVASIVAVMREVWRVLKDDGTLWLNLGDSYAGSNQTGGTKGINGALRPNSAYAKHHDHSRDIPDGLKPKDLVGIPWRVAFALQDDGWYLRSDIIWHKPNPMPESVTDRPTKAHEYVFLLTKQARYFYDAEAIKEPYTESSVNRFEYDFNGYDTKGDPTGKILGRATDPHGGLKNSKGKDTSSGRNRRSVWTVATSPYSGAHFATFPPALVEPMVLAGTSARGECPVCGKAWVRVVETVKNRPTSELRGKYANPDASVKIGGGSSTIGHSNWHDGRFDAIANTLGWRPQCDCARADWYWCEDCNITKPISELTHGCPQCGETMTPAPYDPVPQIVLDPFAGSGTVGQVCRASGRSFVGFDLSLKYLHDNAMPRAQNTNTAASMATLPMFAEMQL